MQHRIHVRPIHHTIHHSPLRFANLRCVLLRTIRHKWARRNVARAKVVVNSNVHHIIMRAALNTHLNHPPIQPLRVADNIIQAKIIDLHIHSHLHIATQ